MEETKAMEEKELKSPGKDTGAGIKGDDGDTGEAREAGRGAVSGSGFEKIDDDKASGEAIDLDFLLDIPLEVAVMLGRTKMLINDLLQLGQGSVIELPKLVGEPLEVLVNNKLVARGEPVMVNEKFGIRLTDIISPMERIERLK